MKRRRFRKLWLLPLLAAVAALALSASPANAAKGCATIQGGSITDSAGVPLSTGYDEFGYNYQARSYNGTYDGLDRRNDNAYYGSTGDFVDDSVQMKWSADWLATVDCNGDHRLDRGSGGISQGWLTNHVAGWYTSGLGFTQFYFDFVKIGWVGPGGSLWEQYAIIQEVYNDTGTGGFRFKRDSPGLGLHDGWTSL